MHKSHNNEDLYTIEVLGKLKINKDLRLGDVLHI